MILQVDNTSIDTSRSRPPSIWSLKILMISTKFQHIGIKKIGGKKISIPPIWECFHQKKIICLRVSPPKLPLFSYQITMPPFELLTLPHEKGPLTNNKNNKATRWRRAELLFKRSKALIQSPFAPRNEATAAPKPTFLESQLESPTLHNNMCTYVYIYIYMRYIYIYLYIIHIYTYISEIRLTSSWGW